MDGEPIREGLETGSRWRHLAALDLAFVVLSGLIGVFSASGSTTETDGTSSLSGWLVLFMPVAFGLGFVIAPLLARFLEKGSTQDWSRYIWLSSGLAPLALFAGAFIASMAMPDPNWSYLANASFPAGAATALAFRQNPLESGKNLF